MTRLQPVTPEKATGKTKELFDGIHKKLGMVPNMMKTMGNSSAVLEGYLNLSDALSKGSLGAPLGELIALAVANTNSCNYCLSAHTFIGQNLVKIDPQVLKLAQQGKNADKKVEAALTFAQILVNKKGQLSDSDLDIVTSVGYTNGEISEIIAHVSLNILTNYFNNVANTEIDFPLTSTI
ncbi:carboxymuconolactone decarboxylase family protein [Aquimarina rhabdastrellae]